MSSLLLLTNPSFGSLGSSQNGLRKHVHSLWYFIHKPLRWLPRCINSKPHSCWPSLPTPAVLVLLTGSASLISLRVPKQASTRVASYCPDSPVHVAVMSSPSSCWTQSFSASSKEWNSLPPSGTRPLLVPLSCSRQIFPAWLLLWLRVTYWYVATWRQRWNHPVFFLD